MTNMLELVEMDEDLLKTVEGNIQTLRDRLGNGEGDHGIRAAESARLSLKQEIVRLREKYSLAS